MERITNKMIEKQVAHLNFLVDIEPGYNIKGCYHMYTAYGSCGIERVTGQNGCVTVVIPLGTKRETYSNLRSFIAGLVEGLAR